MFAVNGSNTMVEIPPRGEASLHLFPFILCGWHVPDVIPEFLIDGGAHLAHNEADAVVGDAEVESHRPVGLSC